MVQAARSGVQNIAEGSQASGTSKKTELKLTNVAVSCSLLDRQLAAQATAFETEGGFTERLYRVRSQKRSLRPPSTRSTKSTPSIK